MFCCTVILLTLYVFIFRILMFVDKKLKLSLKIRLSGTIVITSEKGNEKERHDLAHENTKLYDAYEIKNERRLKVMLI